MMGGRQQMMKGMGGGMMMGKEGQGGKMMGGGMMGKGGEGAGTDGTPPGQGGKSQRPADADYEVVDD
jgi:hypothetical protein